MKRLIYRYGLLAVLSILVLSLGLSAEEGMYPMSELHRLALKAKGLEMDVVEVYNPDGVSLIDGIINLSGCTASFVSADGLILTNYHCAFRAVQQVTTPENDYFRDGFIAEERSKEVEAKGYTVRIIDSYRDVSKEVLKAIKKGMSYGERTKAIEKKIKKIVVKIEKKNPGKRAEVAEMFKGKTYVLFIYTYLKDVRLVYAPPRAIGEFGGEEDNWMWPRHTGDFAFLRAYVAPDGSSADYSAGNVPYHPQKYLKVAPEGVAEGDFIFILGYPGSTYRHHTSYYLNYEEKVRMPYVVDLYSWAISVLERMSKQGRDVAIKLAPQLKGMWNTMKNYRGKLLGMKRLGLTKLRNDQEIELQKFIDADAGRRSKYGDVLERPAAIYKEQTDLGEYELTLRYLTRLPDILSFAYRVVEAAVERKKPDIERKSAYMERNFSRTKQRIERTLRNYYEAADRILLKEMLQRALNLKGVRRIAAIDERFKKEAGNPEEMIDAFIERAYSRTILKDKETLLGLLQKTPKQLETIDDPFIKLVKELYPAYQELEESKEARKGLLAELSAHLIDVKKAFLGTDFIPDANSSLRLTYGRIKGYFPADAVYYSPLTTIEGIVEKSGTGHSDYKAPSRLLELHRKRDFGQFAHPKLADVPVAMLYDADTTGGNSGSPVFNARGELVGLNFDRAFEATINDYGWSEQYSRSIGVDIRFILWFLQKFSGADHLLKEMEVLKQ
jgi:hypothetical protein